MIRMVRAKEKRVIRQTTVLSGEREGGVLLGQVKQMRRRTEGSQGGRGRVGAAGCQGKVVVFWI